MAEENQVPATTAKREQRDLVKPGFTFLPKTWEELFGYAKEICQTDFVPKALQGKPGAVLAAWQTGQEVGLPPMAALQSIAIINGRPSIHSNGFWALITSHPLCEWFHEMPPHEALQKGYGECTIKRRGNPHPIVRRFTMEEAKTAKLLDKDNWRNYPGDMLQNRARHRAGDDALPEACQGLLPADVARDIPPEPRDITPLPDEIKIRIPQPLATTEKTDGAKPETTEPVTTNAGGSSDSKSTAQVDGAGSASVDKDSEKGNPAQSESGDAGKTAGSETVASQPEATVEEQALAAIAGWGKEDFPKPEALNVWMKGSSIAVQTKITSSYNARRKALFG